MMFEEGHKRLHRLTPHDRVATQGMRADLIAVKGSLDGPQARKPYDNLMATVPTAEGVCYEADAVGGVDGFWCRAPSSALMTALLYLHGGAYVIGSADAYRHFVGQIVARARVDAFVPDYRLAPEHPFPAAFQDALAVYHGLVASGARRIALMGDSAGGGLALSLLEHLCSCGQRSISTAPTAAAAISPWTDLALTGESIHSRAERDPLVTEAMLSKTAATYLAGHDARDALASPLYAEHSNLAPISVHCGCDEILLDDSRRYANEARTAGARITLDTWEGMMHVFPTNVGTLEAAAEALELIGTFLSTHLSGQEKKETP